MGWLFASGHVADMIMAIMAVEAVALAVYGRATGRGIVLRSVLTNLAAGVCLVLALRAALVGAHWGVIGGCLTAALVAHLADLAARWR